MTKREWNLLTFAAILVGLVVATWCTGCDKDNGIKTGQVWQYRSDNPFEEALPVREILEVKDGYARCRWGSGREHVVKCSHMVKRDWDLKKKGNAK